MAERVSLPVLDHRNQTQVKKRSDGFGLELAKMVAAEVAANPSQRPKIHEGWLAKVVTFMLVLLGDMDPKVPAAITALNLHTINAPIAQLTGKARHAVVSDECYGVLLVGDNDCEDLTRCYHSAEWKANRQWDEITDLIPQLSSYLRLATRLFLGCLGHSGPLYDAVKHLDEYAFLDMLSNLANTHFVVSQASVNDGWTSFRDIRYDPSLPIQDFFNKVTISVASLKKDGAALKFKRAGPTPPEQLYVYLTALQEVAPERFRLEINEGFTQLDEEAVTEEIISDFKRKIIRRNAAMVSRRPPALKRHANPDPHPGVVAPVHTRDVTSNPSQWESGPPAERSTELVAAMPRSNANNYYAGNHDPDYTRPVPTSYPSRAPAAPAMRDERTLVPYAPRPPPQRQHDPRSAPGASYRNPPNFP